MSLEAPDLDDRSFQDIVDEAKRKIPELCPEWTNHNVSDPGVALIELFAWMSEMVLFRVNQVPDKLFIHFLELMGIAPFSATAARARISFFLSSIVNETVVVPLGTQVGTRVEAGSSVVFTTVDDLRIAQPELVSALTGSGREGDDVMRPVWDDLRYEREAVEAFRSEPMAAGDALYLGFASPLDGSILELTIAASIEGIGVDPRHPPIVWEAMSVISDSDGEGWVPLTVHEDTTGGLNRDGRVLLLMPDEHRPLTLGTERRYWIRVRLIDPPADRPNYLRSPQIRTLSAQCLGGTVLAEHAEPIASEVLGVGTGEPDQVFPVDRSPVLPRTAEEFVQVVAADGTTQDWSEVEDFALSGPEDRHYVWDNANGEISFGPRIRYPDGTSRHHGAAPPDGATVLVTGYRHGGGSAGNVGAETLVAMQSSQQFIGQVTNFEPATGGVDPETVDNAKRRGPLTIMTGQRAVTTTDYERLALESTQSVARVRCLPPSESHGPIRLLTVPAVAKREDELELDDFQLTDELEEALVEHLEPRRMLGATVHMATPYYQGVSVAALVRSGTGRSPAVVRQRVLDALYRYINPLCGGPAGEGWPFEADLNAAEVQQLIASVDGVDRVDQTLFFEVDLRNKERFGPAREVIRLEPDSLFLSSAHQVVVR